MENVHEYLMDTVKELLAVGWRVFIAKSGDYGFFTNSTGERVVDFSVFYLSVSWSGKYKTDKPTQTGVGWRLEPDTYENMFNAYPPYWAVGNAKWEYVTLDMYLATYQKSSQFQEITLEE